MGPVQKVILDVDPGTDDYVALLLLLYAQTIGQIIITAILCAHGNTGVENSCRNVLRLLETVNRTDIPVYRGAYASLSPPEYPPDPFYGNDGFGDVPGMFQPDMSVIRNNSIEAMNMIVSEDPGEVIIISLGALTNVAIAIKQYNNFANSLKSMWIMGGNYKGSGNVENSFAEYNFYQDSLAAEIVLANIKSPVFILPWETCIQPKITLKWRYEVFGAKKNPEIQLLNRADKSIWGSDLSKYWNVCDAFLAASFINPTKIITKSSTHNVTVETKGQYTIGQMVADLEIMKDFKENAVIIEKINTGAFKRLLMRL